MSMLFFVRVIGYLDNAKSDFLSIFHVLFLHKGLEYPFKTEKSQT